MSSSKIAGIISSLLIIGLITGGIYLAQRGPDEPDPTAESTSDVATVTERFVPEGDVTDLIVTDLTIGAGTEVQTGSSIQVAYTGWLASNGTVFDSGAYPPEGYPPLVVGEGSVIRGWDLGLVGMRAGGVRRLIIPSELAYGETGQGPIPPNADLVFEIELLSVE